MQQLFLACRPYKNKWQVTFADFYKSIPLCLNDLLLVSDLQLKTLTNTFSLCLLQGKLILKPLR